MDKDNAGKKDDRILYGEIIAKCWEDEAYKKRFLEEPEEVLAEAGIPVEEGVTYKVIEAPKLIQYIVLPEKEPKEAVQAVVKGFLNRAEKEKQILGPGVEVRAVQNTEELHYLVLPASPKTLTSAEMGLIFAGDSKDVVTNVYASLEVVDVSVVATVNDIALDLGAAAGAFVVVGGVIILI